LEDTIPAEEILEICANPDKVECLILINKPNGSIFLTRPLTTIPICILSQFKIFVLTFGGIRSVAVRKDNSTLPWPAFFESFVRPMT